MKPIFLTLALTAATSLAVAAPSSDTIPAKGAPIKVTALIHASTMLQYGPLTIYVDPISAASYTRKADMVLITHSHGDHLDLAAIRKVLKPGGALIGSPGTREKLSEVAGADLRILGYYEGATLDLRSVFTVQAIGSASPQIKVRAIPAYNIVRERENGEKYHPKYSFDGYVLTLGGKHLYFAGDTENTPEMRDLKGIDAAFLPMNLPYTMTPDEAANAAKAFRPKVVYPYHFRSPFDKESGNAEKFAAKLKGSGIQVVMLDWYPRAAVEKMMGKD